MDGLLWAFPTVRADSRTRWVAEATNPDVLLETMATTKDAHWQSIETGNVSQSCDLDRA
jgi:hypothetical protein